MLIYESKLVNLIFGKKMKLFISIMILLTLNACAKEQKQYLSEYDARVYLNNGGTLYCEDSKTKKIFTINRSWEGLRLGGVSFYTKGSRAIMVRKCTINK
ncbi:hypothetical protein [Sulfurimonas sp.]